MLNDSCVSVKSEVSTTRSMPVCSSVGRWINGKNLSDKRIKARILSIVGFLFGEYKGIQRGLVRELSKEYLFSKHAFGKGNDYRELKEILLVPVGRFVVGKRSNSYALIKHEFLALLEYAGIDAQEAYDAYFKKRVADLSGLYSDELVSGEFIYNENKNKMSSRIYHGLTNEMGSIRNAVLAGAGICYQYDLKSAFPTLIYQGLMKSGIDLDLPHLRHLVENPDEVRKDLAYLLGIRVSDAKQILSALLFGAPLRGKPIDAYCIYTILGKNEYLWDKLVAWPWINGLMDDYKLAKEHLPQVVGMDNLTDETPCAGASGAERFYFSCELLEMIVRKLMMKYVKEKGGRAFSIHDCIATDLDLSVEELVEVVKIGSNGVFNVKISKMEY